MSLLYLSGRSEQNSNDELFLNDQLLGMGTSITSVTGSLAWIEAMVVARCFTASFNFVKLMSNQLTPDALSIFADRFAAIYGLATLGRGTIPTNLNQIQSYIALKEQTVGTPPTLSAVSNFISELIGQSFVGIEYVDPHVQSTATTGPVAPGQLWISPLNTILIRIWQPRDNQDNLLVSSADFINNSSNYMAVVQPWMPADVAIRNLQLSYSGASSLPNYALGNNVVSGAMNGTTITGVGTTFGSDFPMVALGYQMPIEVMGNDNKLYTYRVVSVQSDMSLTVATPIVSTFTARTYRILGIQMDAPNALDNMAFNS